jgi:hypothetical protein
MEHAGPMHAGAHVAPLSQTQWQWPPWHVGLQLVVHSHDVAGLPVQGAKPESKPMLVSAPTSAPVAESLPPPESMPPPASLPLPATQLVWTSWSSRPF